MIDIAHNYICVCVDDIVYKKNWWGPSYRAKWWRYDVDISHHSHQHRGLAGPGLSNGRCGAASISGARKAQKYSTRASKGPGSNGEFHQPKVRSSEFRIKHG